MTEHEMTDETEFETSESTVTIQRTFDAPRERVFEANADPAHIPEWWGPRRFTTDVDEMDVRPGGLWRFTNRDAEGNEYAFHGVYHDVVAPERIVQTFEFEGEPGHVSLETAAFEDVDGKTRLTVRSTFQSVEARDASMDGGMEEGARETWDRLAELVATMEDEDR